MGRSSNRLRHRLGNLTLLQGMKMKSMVRWLILILLLVSSSASAQAGEVTLTWDPVIHPDLAGYKMYYGYASGDYEVITDVGNVIIYTLLNLDEDKIHYFVVTAYSTYGEESEYSNEVCAYELHEPVLLPIRQSGSGSQEEQ